MCPVSPFRPWPPDPFPLFGPGRPPHFLVCLSTPDAPETVAGGITRGPHFANYPPMPPWVVQQIGCCLRQYRAGSSQSRSSPYGEEHGKGVNIRWGGCMLSPLHRSVPRVVKIGQNLSKVVKSSSKRSSGQNGQKFGAPSSKCVLRVTGTP